MDDRLFGMAMATVLLVLATTAAASSSCPCSRPGQNGGLLVGFRAMNGNATNVTIYDAPDVAEPGSEMALTAGKLYEGHVVSVEGLVMKLYREKEQIGQEITDGDGLVRFRLGEPGMYRVVGGDDSVQLRVRYSGYDLHPEDLDFSSISRFMNTFRQMLGYAGGYANANAYANGIGAANANAYANGSAGAGPHGSA